MELLFYNDESIFYDKDGKLKEEPVESLDELLEEYRNIDYSEFKKKELEAAGKYTVTRWIGDTEPAFLEDDRRNYASRTRKNAQWSDITLALAADMESPGEKTTRKAAGDKFVGYVLPDGFRDLEYYPNPVMKMAAQIASLIELNPNFRKEGLRLNIAGNAMPTLSRHGITVNMVSSLIWHVLVALAEDGTKIEEVRFGEGIEVLEYDIDLKIMHLNKKKGK